MSQSSINFILRLTGFERGLIELAWKKLDWTILRALQAPRRICRTRGKLELEVYSPIKLKLEARKSWSRSSSIRNLSDRDDHQKKFFDLPTSYFKLRLSVTRRTIFEKLPKNRPNVPNQKPKLTPKLIFRVYAYPVKPSLELENNFGGS